MKQKILMSTVVSLVIVRYEVCLNTRVLSDSNSWAQRQRDARKAAVPIAKVGPPQVELVDVNECAQYAHTQDYQHSAVPPPGNIHAQSTWAVKVGRVRNSQVRVCTRSCTSCLVRQPGNWDSGRGLWRSFAEPARTSMHLHDRAFYTVLISRQILLFTIIIDRQTLYI